MGSLDAGLLQLGMAVLAGTFAAGGAWLAVRTDMKYLRRDTDDNREEIKLVESRRLNDAQLLHERINRLGERVKVCGDS